MKRWCAALVALLALGCAGTETGNPSFTGQISEAALASQPSVAAIGSSQGGAGVTTLWIAFGDLALARCTSGAQPEVFAPAPNVENLLAPAPRTVALHGSSFCGLDPSLVPATSPLPSGAPSDLAGATLVVGGQRADGVPFLLVGNTTEPLSIADPHGFSVDTGAHALLLGVDVSALFASVDLASATTSSDGTIHITTNDNSALLHTATQNLPGALGLYEDKNHNGSFDPGELVPFATGH